MMITVTDLFDQVPAGGNWRHNAVIDAVGGDHELGLGFAEAGQVLVEAWRTRGPNDLVFLPIVYLYRHALELVLKAAVREAATRLRADGRTDQDLQVDEVDEWLATKGGHRLQALADRLERDLGELHLEKLPADTRRILAEIHKLDPKGDTFRYTTTSSRHGFIPAPRPASTHVDVVAMAETFDETFNLIAGGVMSVLQEYRDYQQAMTP